MMIATRRLHLIPATREHLDAALESDAVLARALDVTLPASWPPEFFEEPAIRFTLERLAEGPDQARWWLHFVVLMGETPPLVGTAGFKGAPVAGTVEVGYSIVTEHQRRGYATEATEALVAHAFLDRSVNRVIAETLPELRPSIGVLEKCGFLPVEESSAPGVLRFARGRASA